MHPKQAIFDNLLSGLTNHITIDEKWNIAEFGVGKEGFSSLYGKKFNKVYGIDIEDYSNFHEGVNFALSTSNHIELLDSCVDLVVSHSVLEHVEDLNVSLSEINRILNPNGYLYLTVNPLYFAAFGAHMYRDGNRLSNWEHLVRGSSIYMTDNPYPEAATNGHYLNGLTCSLFLENVGHQPWNIIRFERIYEAKPIPTLVDKSVAPILDLLTQEFRFIGQKLLPT